ncbi:MAG: OsmC family protein [Elusimicrobia bacterium]|nr:OsmC family protein [Elusimicrobiota bacterium]
MEVVYSGGKKVDANFKGFTIKTDQPVDNGGEGTAPTPFDYFLVSLGACAGGYVFAFLKKRNISLHDAKLIVSFERDETTHMVKKVKINIKLPKNFPKEYTEAIMKSAGLCFVKKHLENPPEFEINASCLQL